jgi:hypothetical protein
LILALIFLMTAPAFALRNQCSNCSGTSCIRVSVGYKTCEQGINYCASGGGDCDSSGGAPVKGTQTATSTLSSPQWRVSHVTVTHTVLPERK